MSLNETVWKLVNEIYLKTLVSRAGVLQTAITKTLSNRKTKYFPIWHFNLFDLLTSVEHKNQETEGVETSYRVRLHASFGMRPQIFMQFLRADLHFDTSILLFGILVLCGYVCTIITILFLKRGWEGERTKQNHVYPCLCDCRCNQQSVL